MECRLVPGRKGRGFVYTTGDGFFYAKNGKYTESRKYVKCTECSVRGVVKGIEALTLKLSNPEHHHSHSPDLDSARLTELKERLKTRAKETVCPLKEVFREVCNE